MQGSGISSDSIWTVFNSTTTAAVRKIAHAIRIAWTRTQDSTRSAFEIDKSTIDGPDLIAGQSTVITQSDYFDYFNEDLYALRMEYDRGVEEPVGGIAYALGDILLDNTSLRFTPDYNNTIGTALLPNRPLRIHGGFTIDGIDRTLPLLHGTTSDVRENKVGRTVEVSAYDYMRYINNYNLESAIYQDQRTDQIIADILTDLGFVPSQYVLEEGLNTIPFAWFQKNQTAGERIRRIVEAEEGLFYQDETGLLRFKNRRSVLDAPLNTSVWTFNPEDIIYWEEDRTAPTINRAVVEGDIRSVKSSQEVWRLSLASKIVTGGTTTLWASFEDPVTSLDALVAGTDYIVTADEAGAGSDISADVDVAVTLFTTDAKLEFTNNYGSDVWLQFMILSGTPATVDSVVEEIYEDTVSQETYGVQQFTVDNDFIKDNSFAYYMARALVRKYKDPRRRLRLTVPAVPQLQVLDRVTVKDQDTNVSTDYRVMRIQGTISVGDFTQVITLREVSGLEAESPFIIDTSTIGGDDVIWL